MFVVDAVLTGQLLTAAGVTDWQHNLWYFLFNVASSQTESEVRCRWAKGEGERADWTERVWGVGPRPFRGRFYLILMCKFRLLDTLQRASTREG